MLVRLFLLNMLVFRVLSVNAQDRQIAIPTPQIQQSDELSKVQIQVVKVGEIRATSEKTAEVSVAIEQQVVTVGKKTTISQLLLENKIRDDNNAKSLVMDLNPELKDLDKLEVGDKIIIPKVDEAALDIDKKEVKQFIVKPTIRGKLSSSRSKLNEAVKSLTNISAEKFESEEKKDEFIVALKNNVASLQELEKQAVSSAAVEAVINEDVVNLTKVVELAKTSATVSNQVVENVVTTSKNLDELNAEAETNSNSNVNVFVAVKSDGQPPPPTGYEIMYMDKNSWDTWILSGKDPRMNGGKSFPQNTPQARKKFPKSGDYVFWAVNPQTGAPVCNGKSQAVGEANCNGEEFCIDLTLQ